ncbi:MAG: MFS transporter [Spirochaetales bacterium]|nr:MFS transporter [Spirochaetales bacterium]
MQENRLKLSTKLGFGIGDIGGNAMFMIVSMIIPAFLADTLGLIPILAGVAIWVARIWDALIDPIIGPISDRTQTRLGRRRPFLLIGGIFTLIVMSVMFFNPHFDTATEQTGLFIWATAMYCLLCTAYSLFNIPYGALTPDLSDNFREQTSLNSWRMGFAVIGTILTAVAFIPIRDIFSPDESVDKSLGYWITGTIFGALIMGVTLITFFTVKEKKPESAPDRSIMDVLRSFLRVLKNKPYRIVLLTYAINLAGITLISSTMTLYFKYIYHNESGSAIALGCLLLMTVLSIFGWNPVIKRIGKHVAYAIGLFIIAGIAVITFFMAPMFDQVFMYIMMGIAGIGMGATYVAPYAMIPDTIEYEQTKSGKREEGAYYGLWTFFAQTGQALAGLLWGFVLQVGNFVAPIVNAAAHKNAATGTQAPETITALRLLLGPLPAVFLVMAGILVLFYPINEKMYKEIMARKRA